MNLTRIVSNERVTQPQCLYSDPLWCCVKVHFALYLKMHYTYHGTPRRPLSTSGENGHNDTVTLLRTGHPSKTDKRARQQWSGRLLRDITPTLKKLQEYLASHPHHVLLFDELKVKHFGHNSQRYIWCKTKTAYHLKNTITTEEHGVTEQWPSWKERIFLLGARCLRQ